MKRQKNLIVVTFSIVMNIFKIGDGMVVYICHIEYRWRFERIQCYLNYFIYMDR